MPKYSITATNLKSQIVKTVLEADSVNDAEAKAFELDLIIEKIEEVGEANLKIRRSEKINFIRLLAVTLNSNLPLLRGLETISKDGNNSSKMTILIETISSDIEKGLSLSEAMANQGNIFSRLEIALVHAGEASGRLGVTLMQLYEYLSQSYRFIKKLKAALTYPLIVFSFSWVVVFIFLAFIVPSFKETYEGLPQAQLPELTEVLVVISDWVNLYRLEIFIAAVIMVVLMMLLVRRPRFRFLAESFFVKLPLFGQLYFWSILVRFHKTFGTLLQNQVNFIEALTIAREATASAWFNSQTSDLIGSVKEGVSLGDYFQAKEILPELAIQMIRMGEESGKLDSLLINTADFYQENLEFKSQSIESIIQPVVIIFLGIFIAFLVLGLFLPLFDLPSALSGA